MITETAFVGCSGLPKIIARSLDKPWHYIGVVPLRENEYGLNCLCRKCSVRPVADFDLVGTGPTQSDVFEIVFLHHFKFITGDMILVHVFFGLCGKCGSAH